MWRFHTHGHGAASETAPADRPDGERDALAGAQSELRAVLEGKASMAELDDASKQAVFNAHENVVAPVNEAEDERMVCTRTKRFGSHRHQLECRTIAQQREERDRAREKRLRQATAACSFNCN